MCNTLQIMSNSVCLSYSISNQEGKQEIYQHLYHCEKCWLIVKLSPAKSQLKQAAVSWYYSKLLQQPTSRLTCPEWSQLGYTSKKKVVGLCSRTWPNPKNSPEGPNKAKKMPQKGVDEKSKDRSVLSKPKLILYIWRPWKVFEPDPNQKIAPKDQNRKKQKDKQAAITCLIHFLLQDMTTVSSKKVLAFFIDIIQTYLKDARY